MVLSHCGGVVEADLFPFVNFTNGEENCPAVGQPHAGVRPATMIHIVSETATWAKERVQARLQEMAVSWFQRPQVRDSGVSAPFELQDKIALLERVLGKD